MKYLLDMNIVSQYAKARRDPRVDAWLERTDDRDLYLSTLTVAELWQGIDRMSAGAKKNALQVWVDEDLMMHFSAARSATTWTRRGTTGSLSNGQ